MTERDEAAEALGHTAHFALIARTHLRPVEHSGTITMLPNEGLPGILIKSFRVEFEIVAHGLQQLFAFVKK